VFASSRHPQVGLLLMCGKYYCRRHILGNLKTSSDRYLQTQKCEFIVHRKSVQNEFKILQSVTNGTFKIL